MKILIVALFLFGLSSSLFARVEALSVEYQLKLADIVVLATATNIHRLEVKSEFSNRKNEYSLISFHSKKVYKDIEDSYFHFTYKNNPFTVMAQTKNSDFICAMPPIFESEKSYILFIMRQSDGVFSTRHLPAGNLVVNSDTHHTSHLRI
jgi:hypothetical protein